MALSIGIDGNTAQWRTCIREYGQILHLCEFADVAAALSHLEGICALYPEPTIAFPFGRGVSLARTSTITDEQLKDIMPAFNNRLPWEDLKRIFRVVQALSLDSYCLPAIRHLWTVSEHRRLKSIELGKPDDLCVVATLMYRLIERETAWSEMNFLFVAVGYNSSSIVVVEDGRIVNGISQDQVINPAYVEASVGAGVDDSGTRGAIEEAFWEELIRNLGGLLAIHHLEDIIVIGERKQAFAEQFADTYQVYYFPEGEPETEGYEVAMGAAIIAEGLRQPGLAGEVVERLQIR
jgi:predicted butyrate kinase (DUF1464 family)